MQLLEVMRKFVEPKSVALIGVSRRTGEDSLNILENIISYGYKGKLYPVNPYASEIMGIKTYASILDVDEPVDLAVITTPRDPVPALARDCASKGIKCISIVAQGFADAVDEKGKLLHKELLEFIKTTDSRIIGPNTFGTANAFINFSSSFVRINMQKNPVGVVCQTGMFFFGFPEYRFVGKGIDIGNASDIDFSDCLEYFENDPDVKVIALHIEGLKNTARFIKTARRVAEKKPIIALKTGKSEQAAKAAQSHSGSLVGRTEIWDFALKQAGVIRVNDLQELFDLTRTFATLPLMNTRKVACTTFSGGTGIMAIDGLQNTGLEIGKLSPQTREKIQKVAPAWLGLGNPIDLWPIIMAAEGNYYQQVSDIMDTLFTDEEVGGIIYIDAVHTESRNKRLQEFLNQLTKKYPDKPLVCSLAGIYFENFINELQKEGRVLAFQTPERAARALGRLYQYSELRKRL